MINVIYHANCNDGFCSAYLLWKEFITAKDISFIPFNYGTELRLDNFNSDDVVYIVDFSFKADIMIALANKVKEIWVLDHHKTAQENFKKLIYAHNLYTFFDMERSGAQLTYDLLNAGINTVKVSGMLSPAYKYPLLVAYVTDRDLWKFELPHSKEINMYLKALPFDFSAWQHFEETIEDDIHRIASLGTAILMYQQREIELALSNAVSMQLRVPEMCTFTISAVNAIVNYSEIAGKLAETSIFSVCWHQREDGKYHYDLRSTEKGEDVSVIAKAFGGGGHARSAGFISDWQVLRRC